MARKGRDEGSGSDAERPDDELPAGRRWRRMAWGSASSSDPKLSAHIADIEKALSHPLRVDLLAILNEREASPSEMARELGEKLELVSYHARVLEKCNMTVLVTEESVGNATEHRYVALSRAVLPPEVWDRLPPEKQHLIDVSILRELWVDITGSMERGQFAGADSHLSITPMVADDQGVKEAKAVVDDALVRLVQIADESHARLEKDGGEPRTWTAGIAAFDSIRDPQLGLKDQRKPRRGPAPPDGESDGDG